LIKKGGLNKLIKIEKLVSMKSAGRVFDISKSEGSQGSKVGN
jgi:hypothetical protein